jgi:Xaa-Pro aminopeptidase
VTRADRLTERLEAEGLDALLVTDLLNLRYLTGFTGSNGFAVVGRELRRFVTDFRYVTQAAGQVRGFDREEGPRELHGALATGWPDRPLRLGFEDHAVSVKAHGKLREVLPDRVELVPAGTLVEDLRAIKEPLELQAIAAAAVLADEALEAVLAQGLAGRTERAVALDLEQEMRLRGAQEPSFATIVAAAGHAALPHAEPRDEPIPPDTLVIVDWGARLDGYCSDCTRTFATGRLPEELAAIYALVERAQAQALSAICPGPTGREADAVAREVIEEGGHGAHFGHGLGHGVGLDVHEAPRLGQASEQRLAAGQVVTVEPGIYVPGVAGVRIEDLVAVTEAGHEVFSGLPKEVRVLA